MDKINLSSLREQGIKEIEEKYQKRIKEIEGEEGLKKWLEWEGKDYKKNQRDKLTKHFIRQEEIEKNLLNLEIDAAEEGEDFTGKLILTVEWKPSRMWRSNPRVYTNLGFTGRSIGGCGYDKLSTATAEALNNDKRIIRLLYLEKEKALRTGKVLYKGVNNEVSSETYAINQEVLGYGSGYNLLPRFEGGVGVDCHKRILERIGLIMEHPISTPNTDGFIISRKV